MNKLPCTPLIGSSPYRFKMTTSFENNKMNFLKRLFSKGALSGKYYLSICCIIKDENAYLEEWINYHHKIGVEHFYIYDNNSKIPIANTLKNLGLSDCSTVKIIRGKAKQVKAYGDCLKRFGKTSQWIAFIDVDEFIVPKTTDGNLAAFLKITKGLEG